METDRVKWEDFDLPTFGSDDAKLFDIENVDKREEKLVCATLQKVAEVVDCLLGLAEHDLGIVQIDQHRLTVHSDLREGPDSDLFDEIGFRLTPKQNKSTKGLRGPSGKLLKRPKYDVSVLLTKRNLRLALATRRSLEGRLLCELMSGNQESSAELLERVHLKILGDQIYPADMTELEKLIAARIPEGNKPFEFGLRNEPYPLPIKLALDYQVLIAQFHALMVFYLALTDRFYGKKSQFQKYFKNWQACVL